MWSCDLEKLAKEVSYSRIGTGYPQPLPVRKWRSRDGWLNKCIDIFRAEEARTRVPHHYILILATKGWQLHVGERGIVVVTKVLNPLPAWLPVFLLVRYGTSIGRYQVPFLAWVPVFRSVRYGTGIGRYQVPFPAWLPIFLLVRYDIGIVSDLAVLFVYLHINIFFSITSNHHKINYYYY